MAADFGFIPNEQPGSYFISYNSEDADRVAPIVRELHESGVPVWYDQGLIPGYEWEYQIAKQIEKCSCVILFATKKLFQREKSYVRTEYDIARGRHNKTVIVAMLDNIQSKDVDDHNIGWWYEINRLHGIANADARKIMTAIGFTNRSSAATPSKSAEENNRIGDDYYYGRNGKPQDYGMAVKYYRIAADQGYAPAQCNLGVCYENGRGVPQDYKEAVRLYRLAADQGDPFGQKCLGVCYENGHGVAQDYKEAVKYYRLAADPGYAEAQSNLGYCYYNGLGVAQDYKEAVRLYRLAADQGYAVAQCNLGICYEFGKGVAKDLDEAIRLYRLAAAQGQENAKQALRRLGR